MIDRADALVIVALAAVFLPLLVVPLLFVVAIAILAALVLSYLFFPTVYILVLEDRGIESAARRARARELVRRHQPLGFFLFVAVVTAVCSVP